MYDSHLNTMAAINAQNASIARLVTASERLLAIAESHEKRISHLEGGAV